MDIQVSIYMHKQICTSTHTYIHTYIHYMTYCMDLNNIIFLRHTPKMLNLEEFCKTPSL